MVSYFAFFIPDKSGGYSIVFPDIPEIVSHGDDLDEAILMAQDALDLSLGEYEREGRPIPVSSTLLKAKTLLEAEIRDYPDETDYNREPLMQLFLPAIMRQSIKDRLHTKFEDDAPKVAPHGTGQAIPA